jgi:hypothetical protein
MKRTDSTKIKWRIQVRGDRLRAWKNRGLFETRGVALTHARVFRNGTADGEGLGRGNVRVVRVEAKRRA